MIRTLITKYIIIYALDAIPTTLGGRTAGTMRRTATITTITTIRRRGRPIRRDTITTVPETLRPSVAITTAIRSTPPPPDSSSNNSNHRACQSRSTMSSSGTSGGHGSRWAAYLDPKGRSFVTLLRFSHADIRDREHLLVIQTLQSNLFFRRIGNDSG